MNIGINQTAAPIRLCFLIKPDSETSFLEAVKLAYSSWGGIYSPILAFYEELPIDYRKEFGIAISTEAYYKNTLDNYDVDAIIIENDIDRKLVERWSNERAVITVDEYLDLPTDEPYGISITEVATHFADEEFRFARSDQRRFWMPEISPNELFLQVWRGAFTEDTKAMLKDIFAPYNVLSPITLGWDNITEYRNSMNFDPRFLAEYRLAMRRNQRIEQRRLIYCFESRRLQDNINYWNLRAAGIHLCPLPVDISNKSPVWDLFKNFYEAELDYQEGREFKLVDCLLGFGRSPEIVREFLEKYYIENTGARHSQITLQTWFPRFWDSHETVMADRIKSVTPICASEYEHYELVDGNVEVPPLPVPFSKRDEFGVHSAYKIMLEISTFDQYAEYAGLLSDLSREQLKRLVAGYSFRGNWRLSAGLLHKIVPTNGRFRDGIIRVPKAKDFFTDYFGNKGYKMIETPNSKLAKEVFKNMGGLYGAFFFLEKQRLKIIELFEENGQISYERMLGEIKKALKNTIPGNLFIERMLETKIIEFGANIKCPVCEQKGYFLPEHLVEHLTCPICRNPFKLPMANPYEIVWSYRGIGPFTRSNKAGGVMSVFAALRLFIDHIAEQKRITPLFGFELRKTNAKPGENAMEVDLSLLIGDRHDGFKTPDLIFCESKTYAFFKQKDIERMQTLGEEFPNAILTFATLNEELTGDEVTLITGLVQHFQTGGRNRPRNPVLILTGKELLSSDPNFPLREYEAQMHAYQRYNDYIGSLCELSVKKHLGIKNWWDISNDLWNEKIYRRQMIGNIVEALRISKTE